MLDGGKVGALDGYRILMALGITLLAVIFIGVVLGITIGVSRTITEEPSPEVTVDLLDVEAGSMKSREMAALEMLRLGADRWMLQCAYVQGVNKASPEAMMESCSLDWGLGPTAAERMANEQPAD